MSDARQAETIGLVGAGWMGLPLGKRLVERGYSVWGTTTRESRFAELAAVGVTPVLFTGDQAPQFPPADVLVVTVPPRGGEAAYARLLEQLIDHIITGDIQKVVFVSSTSVYPDLNRTVSEVDAQMIVSRHSGVCLLAMEDLFRGQEAFATTILRFGGLYGPGRHPGKFLAGKTDIPGGENPVNMIHQTDCIGIISTIIEQNAFGYTWNAVAPGHPARKEFYARAATVGKFALPTWGTGNKAWKQVNGERLIEELGYDYLYPDPGAEWL